jgi:hypothetical protein
LITMNIVIDHFDEDYEQPALFAKKLDLLDQFYQQRNLNIIVITNTHPDILMKQLKEKREDSEKEKETSGSVSDKGQIFNYMINETLVLYLPVNYHHSVTESTTFCVETMNADNLRHLVWEEAFNSNYLWNNKRAVIQNLKSDLQITSLESREFIVRQFSELARNYYHNLLSSCNDHEKFVLADYASDQIMNPNNKYTVFALLRKGLLVKRCDRICFMNESFRRYILKYLNKIEVNKIQNKISEGHHTWMGYKIVLTLIIASLFGFIMIANRNFLVNLKEMFVALGAGIAVITGIIGLISGKKKGGN